MTIGSITQPTQSTSSNISGSKKSIAENFDTFLSLLTTQLKNQNPLDPLNTNQFTQQLVQFTGVEQQLKTNDFLKSLMLSSQTATASQAVSFVGKEVTASTTQAQLQNGKASWVFDVAADAPNATITVKDEKGNTILTKQAALKQGATRFDWDGVNSTGNKLTSGTYQISVDARDANGNYVKTTTQATGIVDSVDFSGSEPYLYIGNQRVALSAVQTVRAPAI